MCNRIKEFAHCIAYAIANDDNLINCVWGDLDRYFEKKSLVKVKCVTNSIIAKTIGYIGKVLKKIRRNKNCTFSFMGKTVEIIINPEFYDWNALFKYKKEVLQYLNFAQEYHDKAQQVIDTIKNSNQKIIGVHIRRGDYKNWRNGRFYYSNEEYQNFFAQIALQCEENVKFMICTNDYDLTKEDFKSQDYDIEICGCNPIIDLLVLSKCDYLIAPPSTYSWWAAFIGDCNYLTLVERNMKIKLQDFEHIGDRFVPNQEYELYKDL